MVNKNTQSPWKDEFGRYRLFSNTWLSGQLSRGLLESRITVAFKLSNALNVLTSCGSLCCQSQGSESSIASPSGRLHQGHTSYLRFTMLAPGLGSNDAELAI